MGDSCLGEQPMPGAPGGNHIGWPCAFGRALQFRMRIAPLSLALCSDHAVCTGQCFAAYTSVFALPAPRYAQVSSDDSITMARRLAVEEGVMVSACWGCGWACVGFFCALLARSLE